MKRLSFLCLLLCFFTISCDYSRQKNIDSQNVYNSHTSINCENKPTTQNPDYLFKHLKSSVDFNESELDKEFIKFDKDNLEKYYNEVGRAWRDDAIEYYTKIVVLAPDDHEAWNNMAIAYINNKNSEKAIECWKKAVEIKPSKVESWSALSKIYDDLGKFDLAIGALEKVLEIHPDISGAKSMLERIKKTQGVA